MKQSINQSHAFPHYLKYDQILDDVVQSCAMTINLLER